MTDSASTTIDAPRFALGDGTAAFAAAHNPRADHAGQ